MYQLGSRLGFAGAFVVLVFISLAGAQGRGGGSSVGSPGVNRVEGRITDQSNNPVYNAYVELYNEVGSMVDRQQSNAQGRFSFRGMPSGRYSVRVKPFRTDLQEDTRDIEVDNEISRSATVNVDIQLHQDKRFANPDRELVGVVFAQDVPQNAKLLYTSAIAELESNHAKALEDLQEAIRLFPAYFEALRSLGKAYVLGGEFEKGYPLLLRAIDVNAKCPDCFYTLGVAFYKLDQVAAGIKAIDAAAILSPQSVSVQLLRGMLYLQDNNLKEAEKALTSANTLAKNSNPEVHWHLARVYNKLNRNQEAAKELEEYLKTSPDLKADEKQSVQSLIAKMRSSKS